MRVDAVGILVAELHPHDRAAARHLRLDDLAGLCWYADRHERTGQPAVRRADVEAGVNDVAADRIVRGGPEAILVLDPEWIIRDIGPAMIVGVGKAAVARKAERKIQIAVLAGNAAIAVVADRQILDDELEFAADAFHFPDLLAVFRDVHRVVLGAVADLVHDSLEDVATDFLDQGSSLVENLDVRRIERVDRVERLAGNGDPQIIVLVDGSRGRRVEPRLEYAYLVTWRHHHLVGIRGDGHALHPIARLGTAQLGFHIGLCSDGWQNRDKCSQHRPRQHPHAFLLAFGLFPGDPGFIGVNDSLGNKSSNECDNVGDVLFCQRCLPGRHVGALADGEASFGYHRGQISVGHGLDVAFAGKWPDMWHEALAATPAVGAVTALAISQEDRFAVPRITGRNRR